MKAIITVGISASGKTTWAKEYALKNKNTIISNRDDLRFSITGAKTWSEYKFHKQTESIITDIQTETMKIAAASGKDIIMSDTNLNKVYRDVLKAKLRYLGFEVEIKTFPIALEDACKRDSLRANGVGKDVIYKQYQQWLEYIKRPIYVPDTSKTKAIIVDIDGTLAQMVDRKPYDWHKVGSDTVRPIVKQMISAFSSTHLVIIVSGRDGVCYEDTAAWLANNGIARANLLMREVGDMRKDTIIKEEIFWRDIAPYYNIEAVFDDRPSVVRMWNELKIPNVIAVADQNMEF